LDCKVPDCREALKEAPSILDHLCSECQEDFAEVRSSLDKLNVPYVIDKRLVRGLDYYARTTFEIQTGSLGAQSAVAGGGRYDGLVKELGGPQIPATGFAIGFDRLAEISGLKPGDYERQPDIFVAALGEKSQSLAFEWTCRLGLTGICAETDFSNKSLKSQMKRANRLGASYVLIVGDKELAEGSVILRNMATKEQTSISLDNVIESLKRTLSP
jgi:histidyl-tRNA synthetase